MQKTMLFVDVVDSPDGAIAIFRSLNCKKLFWTSRVERGRTKAPTCCGYLIQQGTTLGPRGSKISACGAISGSLQLRDIHPGRPIVRTRVWRWAGSRKTSSSLGTRSKPPVWCCAPVQSPPWCRSIPTAPAAAGRWGRFFRSTNAAKFAVAVELWARERLVWAAFRAWEMPCDMLRTR